MKHIQQKLTGAWQDGVNLVLGAWLVLSPLILGYAGEAVPAWNAYLVGAAIIIMAAGAIWAFQQWEEWINALLGLWLVISPWLLGYGQMQAPVWNQIIVGIIAGVLAIWATQIEGRGGNLATK